MLWMGSLPTLVINNLKDADELLNKVGLNPINDCSCLSTAF